MKDKNEKKISWWVRLGCFLTGWNKDILKECSEYSLQKLKRVTSAMMLITLIWFFVLYKFGEFYMGFEGVADPYYIKRVVCGIIGIILVVQIERQIVLNIDKSNKVKWTRIFLAVLMALLGSTIFDQIIFKNDIETGKSDHIKTKVKEQLPTKKEEIDKKIAEFKSEKKGLEKEYQKSQNTLNTTLKKQPTIKRKIGTDKYDSNERKLDWLSGKTYIEKKRKYKDLYKEILNPAIKSLTEEQKNISSLIDIKRKKIDSIRIVKANLEYNLKKEVKSNLKDGFLQELQIMLEEVLLKSWVAMVFWIILFLFMVVLELLVLFASAGRCDYEEIIRKQKELNSLS